MRITSYFPFWIGSLLLLLLPASCTTPVYFAKTLPPEIRIDTIPSTAGFANRYDYTLRGEVREKFRACYQLATKEFSRDMKEIFDKSQILAVRVVDTLLPGIARSSPGIPLPPDSVASMCQRNNVTFLIVLESLSFWITGEKQEGSDDDSKLLSLKAQNIYLVLRAGISFYNSSGDLLHQDSITYRSIYKARLSLTSDIWLFEPNLKKSGPSIIALSKSISEAYSEKFLTQTVNEMRILYAGKNFSDVIRCINQQAWDEAIRLLLPIAGSSDQKLASQAAYNLSVLYEIKGDMVHSDFWFKKSGGKKPKFTT